MLRHFPLGVHWVPPVLAAAKASNGFESAESLVDELRRLTASADAAEASAREALQ